MAELSVGASFTFVLDGNEHEVTVVRREPELVLSVDGRAYTVSEMGALGASGAILSIDDASYRVWRTHEGDRVHVRVGNRTFSVGYEEPIRAAQHHAGGDDTLHADMPGVVVDVRCAAGDHVAAGDTLMTLESMKMQIAVIAPRDGSVETLHVDTNETFDKGAALVSLHPED